MHDSIEKTLKKIGKNKAKKIAIGAAGVIGYSSERKSGENKSDSLKKGIGESATAMLVSPGLYYPMKFGVDLAGKGVKELESFSQKARRFSDGGTAVAFSSKTFIDNKQLYTMREAGMALIKQAKYGDAEAMMGNEASYMHR